MRESNNLVLEQVKSETKNINSNSDVINQNIKHNPNKEKQNFIDSKDKTNTSIQKENTKYSKDYKKF